MHAGRVSRRRRCRRPLASRSPNPCPCRHCGVGFALDAACITGPSCTHPSNSYPRRSARHPLGDTNTQIHNTRCNPFYRCLQGMPPESIVVPGVFGNKVCRRGAHHGSGNASSPTPESSPACRWPPARTASGPWRCRCGCSRGCGAPRNAGTPAPATAPGGGRRHPAAARRPPGRALSARRGCGRWGRGGQQQAHGRSPLSCAPAGSRSCLPAPRRSGRSPRAWW